MTTSGSLRTRRPVSCHCSWRRRGAALAARAPRGSGRRRPPAGTPASSDRSPRHRGLRTPLPSRAPPQRPAPARPAASSSDRGSSRTHAAHALGDRQQLLLGLLRRLLVAGTTAGQQVPAALLADPHRGNPGLIPSPGDASQSRPEPVGRGSAAPRPSACTWRTSGTTGSARRWRSLRRSRSSRRRRQRRVAHARTAAIVVASGRSRRDVHRVVISTAPPGRWVCCTSRVYAEAG